MSDSRDSYRAPKRPATHSITRKAAVRRDRRPRLERQSPSLPVTPHEASSKACDPEPESRVEGTSPSEVYGPNREPGEKMLEEFKDGITQNPLEKTKPLEQDIDGILNSLNDRLENGFKAQQKKRQTLYDKYSEMYQPLFQQWHMEMRKTRAQEEKLIMITKKQIKDLQYANHVQQSRLDDVKQLMDTFLKGVKDQGESHENLLSSERSQLQTEVTKVQAKVCLESQQQDMAMVDKHMQTLVYNIQEEEM